MKRNHGQGITYTALALAALLSACGGGGGGTAASSPQLTGVAATGAVLASGNVSVTDSSGSAACAETNIVTNGLDSYTCTVAAGKTAPFFIVVTDPSGNSSPLVSIATTAPAPLTVNATPLTTAIVATLNNGDALGLATVHTVTTADFLKAKANVLAQLQAVRDSLGPPADYDPFTTSITAATSSQVGNTADMILDFVKITTTATGQLALSTVTDPTPVLLATASSTGSSLGAPTASVSDLSKGAQLAAQAFNACFALPVSTRVTMDANQGITDIANECKNITTQAGVPANAPMFKHNGYSLSGSSSIPL